MKMLRRSIVWVLVACFTASAAYADQQHAVAPAQLAAAVSDHVAAQDADRAAIREALAQPQVKDVAASMGLDLARATRAVDTMKTAELQQAANAARQVNDQLAGGASTIVISTTTIIIVLLIIILIVVVAD
jgi:hypothetical protein